MPVKIDDRQLGRLARRIQETARDVPQTFARAAVSVGRASRTETKRAASAVYNIQQRRIDERLRVTPEPDGVQIIGSKRPFLVQAYRSRQTRRGVAVTIRRERGRILIRDGFTPPKFEGRISFRRVTEKRYPIEPLYGPSVADMLNNDQVFSPLRDALVARGVRELSRIVRRLERG